MLSANVGIKSASASAFGLVSSGTLSWARLLPDRLTVQRYRDFLETVLPGLFEDVPLVVRQKLWFQHDGAPAHCGKDVRQWLNATYPGRWIGRGRPIAWPPRSPALTPMDFFLRGHLKEQVYAVHPRTSEDLVERLTQL
jgi:hypothetical protein